MCIGPGLEAVPFEKMRGLPLTAVCLIELFVAFKSKGRSLMQIRRKFLAKGSKKEDNVLSHSVLVLEDRQDMRAWHTLL